MQQNVFMEYVSGRMVVKKDETWKYTGKVT